MCKPVIAQDGYDNGLQLYCDTHKTREPVIDSQGRQKYVIDVLQHLEMLKAHRDAHDKPFFERLSDVRAILEQANAKE